MHRCRFADPFPHRFALVTALCRLGLGLLLGPIAFPLVPALLAQTAGTGAIAGSITDPSGASVAEAQVKAINEATGEVRTAASTAAGNYTVALLLPGLYTLEISKTGFKLVQAPHISVVVTETKTFNVRMELGQIADKVIVEALAEQLQTQSSALGEVTSGDQVRTLPLVTRNYTQIISLNPGVAGSDRCRCNRTRRCRIRWRAHCRERRMARRQQRSDEWSRNQRSAKQRLL